ncbi:hypothetical protein NIES4106_03520 [Fischerella sp. NIES-4106]|nr:hypothetical protein NIES4106_03520 [Fischerella sp. NIES-4106]
MTTIRKVYGYETLTNEKRQMTMMLQSKQIYQWSQSTIVRLSVSH